MDIVEYAGYPCTGIKITNKLFNIYHKVDVFHDSVRNWPRNFSTDAMWDLFKNHFVTESKECKKNPKLIEFF